MTGSEHYAKAEHLLLSWQNEYAKAGDAGDKPKMDILDQMGPGVLGAAQVHATLALVQATLAVTEYADWDKP